MTLSANEAAELNKNNPMSEKAAIGTEIRNTQVKQAYHPICIRVPIVADATSGQSVTIPYDMYLIDVIVQCNVASGSGTVTLRNSTTNITDAIVCAVNHVVTRAGTIDDAHEDLLTTDSINVITNGAADRGTVYLIGYAI